ncbi:MAG TPA: hypothetical protein VHA07_11060 [Devosia sp.]|nr:hypothetical protein [Devosia sp.]
MPASTAVQFDGVLYDLFEAQTHRLVSRVWPAVGAVQKLTKKKVRRALVTLQKLATEAQLKSKSSKRILGEYDYKKQWHPKRGKGHGKRAKKRNFKEWYSDHITTQNCVYVFWNQKRCLYIGRTLNGKGRPSSHFEKYWFNNATRLDVYAFDRKRDVPRFECMMTHRHDPSYSWITPATKKYYSRCPVCDINKEIKIEISSFFRLK